MQRQEMVLSKGMVGLVLLFRQSFLARMETESGRVEEGGKKLLGDLLAESTRGTTNILKNKETLRWKKSNIVSRFSRMCQYRPQKVGDWDNKMEIKLFLDKLNLSQINDLARDKSGTWVGDDLK